VFRAASYLPRRYVAIRNITFIGEYMLYQKSNLIAKIFSIYLFFFSIYTFSQETSADSINVSNVNKDYILDVYFINGYAIGYQIFNKNNSEIRLILNLDVNGQNYSEDSKEENSSTIVNKHLNKSSGNLYSINLTSHYLNNFLMNKYGKLYWGMGPNIGYSWNNSSNKNYYQENEENKYSSTSSGFSIGLVALIGMRGNLTQSISLFAEAQLSANKNWNWYEYISDTININGVNHHKTTSNGNSWSYNLVYSKIGLRFRL
jgi:hypothetical protein